MQSNRDSEFIEVDIPKLINDLEQFITESTKAIEEVQKNSLAWETPAAVTLITKIEDDLKNKKKVLKELSANLVTMPYTEDDVRFQVNFTLRTAKNFKEALVASLQEREVALNEMSETSFQDFNKDASLGQLAKSALKNALEIFKYPSLAARLNLEDVIPIFF